MKLPIRKWEAVGTSIYQCEESGKIGTRKIADCITENDRVIETLENAKLVAASPNLLIACIAAADCLMAIHTMEREMSNEEMDTHVKLTAAIQKAKGE